MVIFLMVVNQWALPAVARRRVSESESDLNKKALLR